MSRELGAVESSAVETRSSGDVEVRRSRWGFPSLAALTLDRIRFSVGGYGGSGQPRSESHDPHISFIVLCDRGPPTILGLGVPDQGVDPRA